MKEPSATKDLIFDAFLALISKQGYENVSVRDITTSVGIKPASMYNHFESKEKLLEYAYTYYAKHQFDNRKPLDEMKRHMESDSVENIVTTFFYTFVSEDKQKYTRMILITKIIYMRLFQDPLANAMFLEAHQDNAEYVTSVLAHGIAIGRLDPAFDSRTFADVLIGSLEIMGVRAFAGAAYQVGQLDQEKLILALLAKLLSTALL